MIPVEIILLMTMALRITSPPPNQPGEPTAAEENSGHESPADANENPAREEPADGIESSDDDEEFFDPT